MIKTKVTREHVAPDGAKCTLTLYQFEDSTYTVGVKFLHANGDSGSEYLNLEAAELKLLKEMLEGIFK